MLDPEAESAALAQRSLELVQMLDSSHPVVEGCADVLAESKRLGAVATQARKKVAAKIAAGLPVDCPVSHQPAVRRVRTDRRGRDLDPLGGRSAVTPELLEYWRHRKDVVAPAVEGSYRQAAERTPYREALVAACRGHIGVAQQRFAMLSEGGSDLEAALRRYDDAFTNLRMAALDAQSIATEAQTRIAALRRAAASATLGDDDLKGFLASAIAQATDAPLFDPDTAMPLEPVNAKTEAKPVVGSRK
jgi:hypothetical protein